MIKYDGRADKAGTTSKVEYITVAASSAIQIHPVQYIH